MDLWDALGDDLRLGITISLLSEFFEVLFEVITILKLKQPWVIRTFCYFKIIKDAIKHVIASKFGRFAVRKTNLLIFL